MAAAMLIGCPPPHKVTVDRLATGTFRGEWVYPATAKESRQVILYVHGSGYAICSDRTHRGIAARLARLTGMPVFTVDYRLAPEHAFPAAADDVEAAYAWLQDIGYRPQNITVAGDSAGGHLILDLLAENVRRGRSQPRSAVLMSPIVDLTLGLARRREREVGPDPLISARAARRLVRHYTAAHPDDLPRLKLTLDRAADLPRTLIQVGGTEMLAADAAEAQRMILDAGGTCELQTWPGQMHVFQALPTLIPEATPALAEVAAFITRPFESSSDSDQDVIEERDTRNHDSQAIV
ncbi:alpha/beta hydrolase [Gordonia sp. SL306]|uniref:alpha/beta hydrolase n=1 Tax=Gordonia sp. SL306 TaxID=2995145 RepID=UPI0022709E94|nr:alpha/beta hydrolase [Gordonia sp. SL306]WAC57522.1 alpha/beta hydrolase [Gordonia sp. SL306]